MPVLELGQCYCGMIFTEPLKRDEDFKAHIRDRRHDDAMRIKICGPCFAFMCFGCDGKRRGGPWECGCPHSGRDKRKSGPRRERAASMRLTWSTWLANRRPSEHTHQQAKEK